MEWYTGDITNALSDYQEKKGILVVYVYSDNDDGSTIKFDKIWNEFDSSILCDIPYVAIRLAKGSEGANQFAQFFPTPVFPVCYILGLNAQPLEVVTAVEGITNGLLTNSFNKAIKLYREQVKEREQSEKANQHFDEQGDKKNNDGICTSPSDDLSSSEHVLMENPSSTEKVSLSATPEPDSQEEKLEYYRRRLAEKRKEDVKKKEEEEREKERLRRNEGKALSEAREKQRDREIRELADQRRKEKEADAQALKRIREQLRQDKEERSKRSKEPGIDSENKKEESDKLPEKCLNKPVNTEECRIQCRFPDGSTLNLVLPSKSTLQVVFDAVVEDARKPTDFFLVQPYPRKKLTEYDKTLLELNLTPASVLLVVSAKAEQAVVPSSSYLAMLFSIIYLPFHLLTSVYRFVASLFPWTGDVIGNVQQQSQKEEGAATSRQRKQAEITRREGNVNRFRSDESDQSDNEATWNGNSTQQL